MVGALVLQRPRILGVLERLLRRMGLVLQPADLFDLGVELALPMDCLRMGMRLLRLRLVLGGIGLLRLARLWSPSWLVSTRRSLPPKSATRHSRSPSDSRHPVERWREEPRQPRRRTARSRRRQEDGAGATERRSRESIGAASTPNAAYSTRAISPAIGLSPRTCRVATQTSPTDPKHRLPGGERAVAWLPRARVSEPRRHLPTAQPATATTTDPRKLEHARRQRPHHARHALPATSRHGRHGWRQDSPRTLHPRASTIAARDPLEQRQQNLPPPGSVSPRDPTTREEEQRVSASPPELLARAEPSLVSTASQFEPVPRTEPQRLPSAPQLEPLARTFVLARALVLALSGNESPAIAGLPALHTGPA